MAQKPKGHSQITGKYLGQQTGHEPGKRTKRGKTIATATVIDLKGYRQVVTSANDPAPQATGARLTQYLTSASEAVKLAQKQVHRAQEQLQEAQDVEKAMLELAQLQKVRQSHQELYGPDKETGLTAAQQFLAFKQRLRE